MIPDRPGEGATDPAVNFESGTEDGRAFWPKCLLHDREPFRGHGAFVRTRELWGCRSPECSVVVTPVRERPRPPVGQRRSSRQDTARVRRADLFFPLCVLLDQAFLGREVSLCRAGTMDDRERFESSPHRDPGDATRLPMGSLASGMARHTAVVAPTARDAGGA